MKQKVFLLLALALILSSALALVPTTSMAAAKKPKLNMKKLEMTVGDTFQLRIYNLKKKQKVTFVSSNPNIVSVDPATLTKKRAKVKANAIGSATVNATVKKGKRTIRHLKCRIKVSPNAMSIKFTKKLVTLTVGEQFQLDPIIKPGTSTEQPVFESDDLEVATVNSRGVITAISPGIVTIRATLLSTDQTAHCRIVVEEADGMSHVPSWTPRESSAGMKTKSTEPMIARDS